MKEWIMMQGPVIYVFAGCLVLGLLFALIANRGYKRLIRETEMMGTTKNRLLKYIKLKFCSYYKLNMQPQDTRALARHYMYKSKIGFMNVATWIKLSRLMMGLIVISALVDMLMLGAAHASPGQSLRVAGCALVAVGVLYMQNRLYDFGEKQKMLEWYLMDYLENFLRNKLESGASIPKPAEEDGNREAVFETYEDTGVPRKAQSSSDGDDEAAAARIVEDVLKEFLS